MRYFILVFFLLTFQLAIGADMLWSKKGHRTTGEIAQKHLSRKARKAISKLLNGEDLAKVSTFGDDIKSDRDYKKFSAWHYVNFPLDKKYTEVEPVEFGDIIQGIEKCVQFVKSTSAKKEDKVFYLKLLVHLIGDLHQPMHVGQLEDKGGNDIQVQWFNNASNLHKVWDKNMIEDYGMSYTELAESLPILSKKQRKFIQKGSIYDWVEESQDIAKEVYASVKPGEKLYYRYSYVWWVTVEKQLQRGGLRLAKILNEIYK